MSVAAINSSKIKASFSQSNDKVQIAAPGVGVKSTITDQDYASWSGTSMATPHVAGVAALVWSHFPACTNHQIRGVLIKSAEDLGAANCDHDYGFGLVDAKAAYDLLNAEGCSAGDHNDGVGEGGCDVLNVGPPTTSSPTSAPTPFDCVDALRVQVDLTTDNYPSETSYEITKQDGSVMFEKSDFDASGTEYRNLYCKDFAGCATFTIKDQYGDGICCDYGTGSLTVTFGDEVFQASEFGTMESVEFGCPTPPPTLTPVSPPTPPPVTPPSPPTPPTGSPPTADMCTYFTILQATFC
jgi:hypothetical protein